MGAEAWIPAYAGATKVGIQFSPDSSAHARIHLRWTKRRMTFARHAKLAKARASTSLLRRLCVSAQDLFALPARASREWPPDLFHHCKTRRMTVLYTQLCV